MAQARADRSLRRVDLLDLGVSADELRGRRWRAPFYGVHSPAASDLNDPTLQRILDAVELVPDGGALGGWAAGRLLGVPELDGGLSPRKEPVLVLVPDRAQHVSPRPGVRFFRSTLDEGDMTDVHGIRVTRPVRTMFDLVRTSRRPEEALVAADLVARWLGPTADDLLRYADAHRRFRGVPVVRSVAPLVDPLSRSPGESRFRYLWVVEAGLPVPVCNAYVVDATGVVVAMPDLLDPVAGLVGEYDGATHRELASHTEDNVREESFEAMGLVVVRATSLDLGPYRQRTVHRVREHRARAVANQAGTPSWGWRPGRIWTPAGPSVDLGEWWK
jgi:hypothetical protein